MRRTYLVLLIWAVVCVPLHAQEKDTTALGQRLEKILLDNKVPGAGVALVNREGIEWVAGMGQSDVATHQALTPDTLLRIGSISKTFAALAALKLQSEGRLDLQATVRSLAPDVQFENKWEATNPVRVINLLEHTTGWDDLHLKEYANNDPKPLTLKEGLDYAPESRTARWKPGTRFSYCNSGPAVTAYIIEKITGQRFEDYVQQHFFDPIGMTTADYLYAPRTQQLLTKLYHSDGKTPYPYWHIMLRPAGSMNASAHEMGYFVQFLLNRGAVNGTQVVPAFAVAVMERPQTYYGAQAGLTTGYAKHNYTTLDDNGFVWHGHNGGVDGSLSELAYLPDQGVGYFYSINASSGKASGEISKLIKAYITKDLQKPDLPLVHTIPAEIASHYAGWYQGYSPRQQSTYFVERLMSMRQVRFEPNRMIARPIIGSQQVFWAVSDHLYRADKKSVATVALMDTDDGRLLQYTSATFLRVPAGVAWAELGITALTILAMISVVLFALVWLPRLWLGKLRGVKLLSVRVLPLTAVLAIAAAVALAIVPADDFLARFGKVTAYSVGISFFTVAFAGASLLSLAAALRANKYEMNHAVYWHSLATAVLLTIVTIYLMYWGVIGYRSWA